MPQTAIDSLLPIGSAGQLADLFTVQDGDVIPGTNEEASLNIGFGLLTYRSSMEGIKLPTTLANVKAVAGILVQENLFDVTTQLVDATVHTFLQSAIKPGVVGNVLRRGRIIVIPENTGTEASSVFVRIVAGTGSIGGFRTTAVVGETVLIPVVGAKWIGTPTAGTPSILEINVLGFDGATAS